jgi:hypothetical protein
MLEEPEDQGIFRNNPERGHYGTRKVGAERLERNALAGRVKADERFVQRAASRTRLEVPGNERVLSRVKLPVDQRVELLDGTVGILISRLVHAASTSSFRRSRTLFLSKERPRERFVLTVPKGICRMEAMSS